MASKKKRSKSFNPNKAIQRVEKALVEDSMIVFVGGGSGKSHVMNRKTNVIYPQIGPTTYNALKNKKHTWTYYCAVLCRDQQLNNYVKAEEYYFTSPVLQTDIQNWMHDRHLKLLHKQNKGHVIGIAWIACPYDHDFDEELAYNVFEKLGGFNKKALWQKTEDL